MRAFSIKIHIVLTCLDFKFRLFRVHFSRRLLDVEHAVAAVQVLDHEVNGLGRDLELKVVGQICQGLNVLQVGQVDLDKVFRLIPR